MSHHPRCVYAHNAEAAKAEALKVRPPPPIATVAGKTIVNMTGTLATLIDLACPPECLNGQCAHEPKREHP